jgi:hypothetical protein
MQYYAKIRTVAFCRIVTEGFKRKTGNYGRINYYTALGGDRIELGNSLEKME